MSGEYGSGYYGSGNYGGKPIAPYRVGVPILVDIFDSLGTYKQAYMAGHCDLISCDFSHDESGCREFKLLFGSVKNINKNDIIKIKIFSSDRYFFTGVCRIIPITGSTKYKYEYSGQGLNSYFQRLNTCASLSYTNKSVNYIVGNLLDTLIVPNTQIKKNLSKIDALSTVVSSATFHYCQISDCLDALKKIANSDGNDYLIGVDETGEFFFRARDTAVKVTLNVGTRGKYTIPNYEPSDEYEARTKYYVLKKDGTYWTTLTSSIAGNDIYEEKLTAPDLADADLTNWGTGLLKENERNQRTAQIKWKIEDYYPDVLVADGWIRIFTAIPPKRQQVIVLSAAGDGNAGDGLAGGQASQWTTVDDTLRIVEVSYTISNTSAFRNITLGALYPRLEQEIVNVRKKLIDLTISLGV
jgi:hypothetical protein